MDPLASIAGEKVFRESESFTPYTRQHSSSCAIAPVCAPSCCFALCCFAPDDIDDGDYDDDSDDDDNNDGDDDNDDDDDDDVDDKNGCAMCVGLQTGKALQQQVSCGI